MLKPPIPENEEQRLATLLAYDVLDTLPERLYDNITLLASQICGTPIALISLIDGSRQWFKSRVGLDAPSTPRELSFCGHAILQDDVFQIVNSEADVRFADNPLVTDAPRVVFYAGAPLRSPSGDKLGTLCVIDHTPRELTSQQKESLTALSEQVVALLEMRLAVKQAREASQIKSDFLANMSHEIRTPLGAIIGFADLLSHERLELRERSQFAETISRNAKSLAQIIDDILDLAKVEAGKLEIEKVEFDLHEHLEDVVTLFREKVSGKGIYLRTAIDAEIPKKICSDPTRLRQILINLVGNAVKFTQTGGVTVKFLAPDYRDDGILLRVMVKDTGVGIDPGRRAHLFQPFVQADSTTTRKFGGTGLGLALAKKLAIALGGDIELSDCEIDRGCSFLASFMSKVDESSLSHCGMAPTIIAKPQLALEGLRILVADDSPDNLFLVKRILGKFGAVVETANDGREAVDKALASEYDVVLLDIQMPVMDGYQAIETLKGAGYPKPVIALTAHAMAEAKAQTRAAGFDSHVCKPLNQAELLETLGLYKK